MRIDLASASRAWLPVASAAALGACTAMGPPRPGRDGEVIRYETEGTPFCIVCSQTKLVVASNGHAWIEQTRRSPEGTGWDVVRRPVLIPPERLAAFRARLASYRPRRLLDLRGPEGCTTFMTDSGGVRIEWDDGRTVDRLFYNDGCDPDKHKAMRDALEGAPLLLGLNGIAVPPQRARARH
jgi:hypothetical protein